MHTFWKKSDCKMNGFLPWYYYFVTIVINMIIKFNILDIDFFSPAGNQHLVNIYLQLLSSLLHSKTKQK